MSQPSLRAIPRQWCARSIWRAEHCNIRLVKLRVMPTKSTSGAVVFALEVERGSDSYTNKLKLGLMLTQKKSGGVVCSVEQRFART